MSVISSFAAVARHDARVLILGSIPGIASLDALRYYNHPRNVFWNIIFDFFGVPLSADYELRLEFLREKRLALWDVLAQCVREGSLDASIQRGSESANDIPALIECLPSVHTICLNGAAAGSLFRRYFGKDKRIQHLNLHQLPSTSPANARLRYDEKFELWSKCLSGALQG